MQGDRDFGMLGAWLATLAAFAVAGTLAGSWVAPRFGTEEYYDGSEASSSSATVVRLTAAEPVTVVEFVADAGHGHGDPTARGARDARQGDGDAPFRRGGVPRPHQLLRRSPR